MSKKSISGNISQAYGAFTLSANEFSVFDENGVEVAEINPKEKTVYMVGEYTFEDRNAREKFVEVVNSGLKEQ